jgi:AcrR family transcriptional regulator
MDLVTQQLHERRERILQAARELIGEGGYQSLTMRELAARCRVSVPTLYNQFGSKNELLATAVQSHFSGLLASGDAPDADASEPEAVGHEHLVAVIRLCSGEMARLPNYHRALVGAFMELRDTDRTQAVLTADLSTQLARALGQMRERNELADWVDPSVLADQIMRACIASAVAWMAGALDDDGLQAAMLHTACCMTLGAARGEARAELERHASTAQDQLARQPGVESASGTPSDATVAGA